MSEIPETQETDVLTRLVKWLPDKKIHLEGETTIFVARKIVEPLKAKGVDVKASVSEFLTYLNSLIDEQEIEKE